MHCLPICQHFHLCAGRCNARVPLTCYRQPQLSHVPASASRRFALKNTGTQKKGKGGSLSVFKLLPFTLSGFFLSIDAWKLALCKIAALQQDVWSWSWQETHLPSTQVGEDQRGPSSAAPWHVYQYPLCRGEVEAEGHSPRQRWAKLCSCRTSLPAWVCNS